MLMVRTRIGQSTTHGIGLFAAEFIPKGTVTWRFMPNLDLIVPEDILLQISEASRAQFLNYCYVDKFTKHFILCFDDERFINHSKTPNITQSQAVNETEGVEIAVRDIQEGEELFCDYDEFDFDAHRKLNGLDLYKYAIDRSKEDFAQFAEKEHNFIAKLFAINTKAAPKKKEEKVVEM